MFKRVPINEFTKKMQYRINHFFIVNFKERNLDKQVKREIDRQREKVGIDKREEIEKNFEKFVFETNDKSSMNT